MPGQHHTPIRIGRDLHPLLALDDAVANGDTARANESAAESAADSIGSREVAGISASKYFSVLRSSSGEVWTCGGELSLAQDDGRRGHDMWCRLQFMAMRWWYGDVAVLIVHPYPYRRLQWRAGPAVIVGDLPTPGVWTRT
jgi:hypothetical protein